MRKFLLVVLVGMVLAMDVYGFVNEYEAKKEEERLELQHQKAKEEVYTIVYME